MMFEICKLQATDNTWMLSKWAYNRLRSPAQSGGRSMGATARRAVNEFFRMCRLADYDLSKLQFQMMDFEPRTVPVTMGIDIRKDELNRVCSAGRFSPDQILEIALSCQGFKKAALNVAG